MSQVPIDSPDMTGDLARLEKARLAMRRQALEHLAEAEHGINGLQEAWVHELLEIAGHGESFLSGK